MQIDDIATEYCPALHDMQVEDDFAPLDIEYWPARQAKQPENPGPLEYCPAPHNMQVDDEFASLVAEYFPARQAMQLAAAAFE